MLLWIRQQVKANEKQSNPNTLRDQPTKCLKEIIDHLGSSDHILTTTEECKMVCTVTGSLISCHQEFLEYSGVTIQKKKTTLNICCLLPYRIYTFILPLYLLVACEFVTPGTETTQRPLQLKQKPTNI